MTFSSQHFIYARSFFRDPEGFPSFALLISCILSFVLMPLKNFRNVLLNCSQENTCSELFFLCFKTYCKCFSILRISDFRWLQCKEKVMALCLSWWVFVGLRGSYRKEGRIVQKLLIFWLKNVKTKMEMELYFGHVKEENMEFCCDRGQVRFIFRWEPQSCWLLG